MLLTEDLCDPDDHGGFSPARIGHDLPEVAVVGGAELVLNDDNLFASSHATDQIQREGANLVLSVLEFDFEPQDFGEHIRIVEEPRREAPCFGGPHLSNVRWHEPTELHCGSTCPQRFTDRAVGVICTHLEPFPS
jgi:hypothetical protein